MYDQIHLCPARIGCAVRVATQKTKTTTPACARRARDARMDSMARNESKQLAAGQKVRDVREKTEGVVMEFACQYAHPKAKPVYSYLIRWQDGQVNAVTEAAFQGDIELVD